MIDALGAIDAPLLLLHGERDGVCPPSHSRVVFHALHSRGVPTELVLYPEEGHTVELRATAATPPAASARGRPSLEHVALWRNLRHFEVRPLQQHHDRASTAGPCA